MEVTTKGLDLGKDVFQVHGITFDGGVVFNRTIRRRQLLKFFETLPCCLVGIEACGSAHHWARELIEIGHDVRLMPAVCVNPNAKHGKTDVVDAEAICEAVTRPTMRFIKTFETDDSLDIPDVVKSMLKTLYDQVASLEERAKRIRTVPGVGPITA